MEARGFTNGGQQLRHNASFAARADRHLRAALAASTGWTRGPLGATLAGLNITGGGQPRPRKTNDQEKAAIAVRLLAYFASTAERFFLALGLSATHVQGPNICLPGAASAAVAAAAAQVAEARAAAPATTGSSGCSSSPERC